MPRNGDGSGDSGPFEGHEIVHGTSGDTSLQHTKHVAPMPDLEDGEALPGMNASGGAAAPLNDASEEYGSTAPRNEQYGDDETSASNSGTSASKSGTSASKSGNSGSSNNHTGNSSFSSGTKSTTSNQQSSTKLESGSQQTSSKSSSGQSSGHDTHGFHKEQGKHDLEDISRQKAERYVNLNEEDVQHAGAGDKSNDGAERSSQRAPRDVGPKEDIEQLHGKASIGKGDDKSEQRDGGRSGKQADGGSQQSESERSGKHGSDGKQGSYGKQGNDGKQGSDGKQGGDGKRGNDDSWNGSGNGAEHGSHESDPMRHNAAKFVNIDE